MKRKAVFVLASDWYFWAHWHPLACGIQRAGYDVTVITPSGKYVPNLASVGLRHLAVEFDRQGRNPLHDAKTFAHLAKTLRDEDPDIVQTVALKPILYGTLAGELLRAVGRDRRPRGIVNTMPGMGYVFLNPQRLSRTIRPFIKGFFRGSLWSSRARLVLLNRNNHEAWLAWAKNPSRTRLIGGAGIDLKRFPFVPEAETTTPNVILPARLLFDKGVREFVQAAYILKQRNVNVRMQLVGEPDLGNPASVSHTDMQKWQSEGVIDCLGWRDDMHNVYAQSSIVCLPSYGEGVPQALVEGLATGRATIASDVPGCHDVVRHGDNGLLVPVKDAEALAEAIESLAEDRARRLAMGKRGREIAESEYAIERIVEQYLALYDEVLR
jgi:glycosyltransferase involved in cell wall biosynthesis